MRKYVVSAILTLTILFTPFIRVGDAKAASLVEYALLSSLIGQMQAAANRGVSYDLSKAQYCTTANTICSSAENDLSNLKLNSQILQLAGIKCFQDFYLLNKRYPTSAETTTHCGAQFSLFSSSSAVVAAATVTKNKACEMKALACKDFPAVTNPIQQQFQSIGQQL